MSGQFHCCQDYLSTVRTVLKVYRQFKDVYGPSIQYFMAIWKDKMTESLDDDVGRSSTNRNINELISEISESSCIHRQSQKDKQTHRGNAHCASM